MSKYGNKKVIFQGIKFDSRGERDFYLLLCDKYGKENIILQPKFVLQESFGQKGRMLRSINYIADFMIGNNVYDYKGVSTELFNIKKKLFMKRYPEYDLQVVTKLMMKKGLWH